MTATISAPETAGKGKLEPSQQVQFMQTLIDEADSISLNSPLTKITTLVENCMLGSDPSIPNINKFPILVFLDRLSIDATGFPEDEVCDNLNLDEPQYDEDVSIGEILRPKKLLPRLGSKTLTVLRTVAENPCGISLNGPPVHFSQVLVAIRESGRVRNNKDVVPYLTIACSSIHCVGGGDMSGVPDCERWTARVCRDLPAVAKLLDPTVLFLLTGPGVPLPAFDFGNLPVGPNNMQISGMPQHLVAPVGATGHAGGGVAVRSDNVLVLNATRDIGLVSAAIRRQALVVCLARLSTNGNYIWQ